MKAMCVEGNPPSSLVEKDLPVPQPGPDEILVRVHAAGVTPTEMLWYPTTHAQSGEPRLEAVPAHEFSGTIAALGSQASGFSLGQEIYGLNDWFSEGAAAEYCLTQSSLIAPKPARLSHAEAAGVPISALTAWQGLFNKAQLRAGERVLIHGAAGAVGLFAVQWAKRAGAFVVTTSSAKDGEFLKELGADQVIDYRRERFEERAGEVDVIFDGVGGETLARSWAILSAKGRLVTIAASGEEARDERSKAAFFIVEPSQDQLMETARLLDQGDLKTFTRGVIPLAQASSAYFNPSASSDRRGKQVIAIAD